MINNEYLKSEEILVCPVCGGKSLGESSVLWPELISEWQLSSSEEIYINRQQGFHCKDCRSNLRSMALATAIMNEYNYSGLFSDFCNKENIIKTLEINQAGNLSLFLSNLQNRKIREYPDIDMHNIDEPNGEYDLVLHSDTLEHLENPVRALQECKRILKKNGKCIFTIPIIVDRFSRNRRGLSSSYHGNPKDGKMDFLVHTEFGADFWKFLMEAGFKKVSVEAFEYPSAMVVIAGK
jgi:SAM-dependent methyltransferase